jgi:DNA-binding NtrC family response regulator
MLTLDRFDLRSDNTAIDLASGDVVTLITSVGGSRADDLRWSERCEWFSRLRHPAIARLVDFGMFGEHKRFEAWRGSARADAGAGASVAARAARFLTAVNRGSRDLTTAVLLQDDDRAVLLPSERCGYEGRDDDVPRPDAQILDLADCGFRVSHQPSLGALADAFCQTAPPIPRAIALWGPPGSGVRTMVLELARHARVNGFVPIDVSSGRLSLRGIEPDLRGRSLFLIASEMASGWRLWLHRLQRSARPHVLLFASHREIAGVDGVSAAPLSREQLVEAVLPTSAAIRVRLLEAARAAKGIPGWFVAEVWGHRGEYRVPRSLPSRVAEQPASYGDAADSTLPVVSTGGHPPTVRHPKDTAALQSRLGEAAALLARGRHEPGTRLLRQVLGHLDRRGDVDAVIRGTIMLAKAFVRRGRARDAQNALDSVSEPLALRDSASDVWLEAAVLRGSVSIDLGRLDDSEMILQGALRAARSLRDRAWEGEARLALSRCLFWRGRYDEASRLLEPVESAGGFAGHTRERAVLMASRIAIGRGDLAGAVSRAVGALEGARECGDPARVARAACASTLARRAVGDLVAASLDAAECVKAARVARHPLRALRARILAAESASDGPPTRISRALRQRLAHLDVGQLPATMRARCELLRAVFPLSGRNGMPVDEAVRKVSAATGLAAMSIYAPRIGPPRVLNPAHASLGDFLEIVTSCQSALEGNGVLESVIRKLKQQLNAVAVACVSADGRTICSDGGRVTTRIAERVLAAQTIVPHSCDGHIEGGATVVYAGETIAALLARWAPGGPTDDIDRSAAILTLAAAAVAPAVAEALSDLRRRAATPQDDILGRTEAVEKVRRLIEQAAAAPYPILIEGESGSGKELIARAIHRHSPRRERAFCALNCAALPDDLVESELFGHARGAFTGAAVERAGVFEEAHAGTLFLDEVGELSARAQAKLLRTIQEGEVRRVGENVARRVDLRIVAATNRNLRDEVGAGRFRQDLLFRLDVIRIALPPLRDRREDIAEMVEHFWRQAMIRLASKAVLAPLTIAALTRYHWPGNVRELQNVLAALAVRSPKRGLVPPTALPPHFHDIAAVDGYRLEPARRLFEERFVRAALARSGGHRPQAARELGVTRQGLVKLMARLGILE